MMTGKYAKVPYISAMHNCLASALRGIRQGPAWHYARHLCMAKYRSRGTCGYAVQPLNTCIMLGDDWKNKISSFGPDPCQVCFGERTSFLFL